MAAPDVVLTDVSTFPLSSASGVAVSFNIAKNATSSTMGTPDALANLRRQTGLFEERRGRLCRNFR